MATLESTVVALFGPDPRLIKLPVVAARCSSARSASILRVLVPRSSWSQLNCSRPRPLRTIGRALSKTVSRLRQCFGRPGADPDRKVWRPPSPIGLDTGSGDRYSDWSRETSAPRRTPLTCTREPAKVFAPAIANELIGRTDTIVSMKQDRTPTAARKAPETRTARAERPTRRGQTQSRRGADLPGAGVRERRPTPEAEILAALRHLRAVVEEHGAEADAAALASMAIDPGIRRSIQRMGVVTVRDLLKTEPHFLLGLPQIGPVRTVRLLNRIAFELPAAIEEARSADDWTGSPWSGADAPSVEALRRIADVCTAAHLQPAQVTLVALGFAEFFGKPAKQRGPEASPEQARGGPESQLQVPDYGPARARAFLAGLEAHLAPARVKNVQHQGTETLVSPLERQVPRPSAIDAYSDMAVALTWQDASCGVAVGNPPIQIEVADCVPLILAALPERIAAILVARFGLHGEAPTTASQAGKVFGLTRERIRQIVAQALDALRRSPRRGLLAALRNDIYAAVVDQGGIVAIARLDKAMRTDQRFGLASPLGVIGFVLSEGKYPPREVRIGGVPALTTLPDPTFQLIADNAATVVSEVTGLVAIRDVTAIIAARTVGIAPEAIEAYLITYFGRGSHEYISRLGRVTKRAMTISVLEDAAEPLSPVQIHERLRERFPMAEISTPAAVQSMVTNHPAIFTARGRGAYELVNPETGH